MDSTEVQHRLADWRKAKKPLTTLLIKRGDNVETFPNKGRQVPELRSSLIKEVLEGNNRIVSTAIGHAWVCLLIDLYDRKIFEDGLLLFG